MNGSFSSNRHLPTRVLLAALHIRAVVFRSACRQWWNRVVRLPSAVGAPNSRVVIIYFFGVSLHGLIPRVFLWRPGNQILWTRLLKLFCFFHNALGKAELSRNAGNAQSSKPPFAL